MSEAFTPILFQLGIGGIGGFFIGYMIRKIAKIALIIGIVVFSLIFLAYKDVVHVNYDELANAISKIVYPTLEFFTPLFLHLPFIGSLILGIIVGFKKG